ncbi:MAG TPA: zinc-ribbon and DUF3426 domain-containing protein [Methylibium sp.]|nr:zinc-ribbon and DUF3426 domain-containing protein [Methylibium sp.]
MSLATRCSSCGTVFRVVQDQLKVSEGWVRCGRCQQVFNALEALFDLEREAPPQRAPIGAADPTAHGVGEFVASHLPPAPDEEELPATHEDDAIESRFFAPPPDEDDAPRRRHEPPDFVDARFPSELPLDDDDAAAAQVASASTPPDELPPVPRPKPLLERWRARRAARRAAVAPPAADSTAEDTVIEAPPRPAAAWPYADEPEDDSSLLDTRALLGDESMLMAEVPAAASPADDQAALAEMAELMARRPAEPADGPTPAFLREAENAARWQRPRVRVSLAVAGLLLCAGLAVQVGLHFRDAFAARWPEARPALAALCEALACEIGPLRRVAALSVEASGLAPGDGSDTYRLTLTLRNRDSVVLATPSVDLSLTDLRGDVIARKVLGPADLQQLPADRPLGSGLDAASETPVEVLFTLRGPRVSGYTVELFYP